MALHPSVVAAAFLSTGLISLAPNVLLFLFPKLQHNDRGGRAVLSLGQALAVGGLVGDVFLHTLPDCFADALHHDNHNDDSHSHHHGGGGEEIGLRVIMGLTVFLILDIVVRSLEEKSGGGHSHSRGNSDDTRSQKKEGNRGTNEKAESNQKPWRCLLSSAVLLNLLGDSLHNFTDGIAIGATFAVSQPPQTHAPSLMSWTTAILSLMKSKGGLASISVFLHEIPHELGDFATLVRAGLTRNMAIGAQFLTAIFAFLGTAFGLFSGQIIEGLGHDVLLPFTAGGFLYLSCATILPDVLETDVGAWTRLLQIGSFLLGVGFMYAVAVLEDFEYDEGHSHSKSHNEL